MNEVVYKGIDIGSKNIKIMFLSYNKETNKTKIIYKNSFPSQGVDNGYISNLELFNQSLNDALKKNKKETGRDIKDAVFTIDSFGLKSKSININHSVLNQNTISNVDIDEIERKINIIARKNISGEILDLRLVKYKINNYEYFSSIEGLGGKKVEAEYIAIHLPSNHFSNLEKAATSNDVSIININSGNIVSGEINLDTEDKKLGVLNIDMGADKTSFSIWEDNKLIFLDSINYGSDDITKNISLEYKISFSEAENLKKNFKEDKKIEKIIKNSVKDIAKKIKEYLKELDKELLPSGAVIYGGGAKNELVIKTFKEILNLPVKKYSKNILDSSTDYHSLYAALVSEFLNDKKDSLIKINFSLKPLKNL